MNLSGAAYGSLSDADLDSAYAAVYGQYSAAAGQDKVTVSQTLNDLYQEVVNRQQNVSSFFTSLFTSRFPQFDQIQKTGAAPGGFVAGDVAKQSIETSAANVATTVEQGVVSVAKGGLIVSAVAGVIALWFIFGRK